MTMHQHYAQRNSELNTAIIIDEGDTHKNVLDPFLSTRTTLPRTIIMLGLKTVSIFFYLLFHLDIQICVCVCYRARLPADG